MNTTPPREDRRDDGQPMMDGPIHHSPDPKDIRQLLGPNYTTDAYWNNYRRLRRTRSPPITMLKCWRFTIAPMGEHHQCMPRHHIMVLNIPLGETQFLRRDPSYFALSPEEVVGHIYILCCVVQGTTLRVELGNRMFDVTLEGRLSRHYQVLTGPTAEGYKVVIILRAPRKVHIVVFAISWGDPTQNILQGRVHEFMNTSDDEWRESLFHIKETGIGVSRTSWLYNRLAYEDMQLMESHLSVERPVRPPSHNNTFRVYNLADLHSNIEVLPYSPRSTVILQQTWTQVRMALLTDFDQRQPYQNELETVTLLAVDNIWLPEPYQLWPTTQQMTVVPVRIQIFMNLKLPFQMISPWGSLKLDNDPAASYVRESFPASLVDRITGDIRENHPPDRQSSFTTLSSMLPGHRLTLRRNWNWQRTWTNNTRTGNSTSHEVTDLGDPSDEVITLEPSDDESDHSTDKIKPISVVDNGTDFSLPTRRTVIFGHGNANSSQEPTLQPGMRYAAIPWEWLQQHHPELLETAVNQTAIKVVRSNPTTSTDTNLDRRRVVNAGSTETWSRNRPRLVDQNNVRPPDGHENPQPENQTQPPRDQWDVELPHTGWQSVRAGFERMMSSQIGRLEDLELEALRHNTRRSEPWEVENDLTRNLLRQVNRVQIEAYRLHRYNDQYHERQRTPIVTGPQTGNNDWPRGNPTTLRSRMYERQIQVVARHTANMQRIQDEIRALERITQQNLRPPAGAPATQVGIATENPEQLGNESTQLRDPSPPMEVNSSQLEDVPPLVERNEPAARRAAPEEHGNPPLIIPNPDRLRYLLANTQRSELDSWRDAQIQWMMNTMQAMTTRIELLSQQRDAPRSNRNNRDEGRLRRHLWNLERLTEIDSDEVDSDEDDYIEPHSPWERVDLEDGDNENNPMLPQSSATTREARVDVEMNQQAQSPQFREETNHQSWQRRPTLPHNSNLLVTNRNSSSSIEGDGHDQYDYENYNDHDEDNQDDDDDSGTEDFLTEADYEYDDPYTYQDMVNHDHGAERPNMFRDEATHQAPLPCAKRNPNKKQGESTAPVCIDFLAMEGDETPVTRPLTHNEYFYWAVVTHDERHVEEYKLVPVRGLWTEDEEREMKEAEKKRQREAVMQAKWILSGSHQDEKTEVEAKKRKSWEAARRHEETERQAARLFGTQGIWAKTSTTSIASSSNEGLAGQTTASTQTPAPTKRNPNAFRAGSTLGRRLAPATRRQIHACYNLEINNGKQMAEVVLPPPEEKDKKCSDQIGGKDSSAPEGSPRTSRKPTYSAYVFEDHNVIDLINYEDELRPSENTK